MEAATSWKTLKQEIRRQAHANRRDQPDKDALSAVICDKFASLPAYASAETAMCYVDMRSEVRTRPFLREVLASGKRLVVPYCVGSELELFWLRDMEDLEVATFGILEPRADLRGVAERKIDAGQLDLVMVPGVAFDRRGARLGHGKGYYDRLLTRVRLDTPLVGIAFECQMFPEIPMATHDVFMDMVITETAVYQGRGRRP